MAARALTLLAFCTPLVLSWSTDEAHDPVAVRYAWSKPTDCSREASVVDLNTTRDVVRGRVQHQGKEPIRDVMVCIDRRCTKLDGVMTAGKSARFEIASSSRRPLTVRCSILEERVTL